MAIAMPWTLPHNSRWATRHGGASNVQGLGCHPRISSPRLTIPRKQIPRYVTIKCNGNANGVKNPTKMDVPQVKNPGKTDTPQGENSIKVAINAIEKAVKTDVPEVEKQNDESGNMLETNAKDLRPLSFTRLQPTEEDCKNSYKRSFGKYVAREAVVDEEYWTAAWLRAESHYEEKPHNRFVDSHKRKFAEQEFTSLKRRCVGREGQPPKCLCLVTVKKEDRCVRRTVLNSVVGTLDLSIRQLLHGETFPGEHVKSSVFRTSKSGTSHRYAYVANVCVTKYARRQGIASNMLQLAIEVAEISGAKVVFMHVNTDNKGAQQLYRNMGFEIVEAATSLLLSERKQLLCRKTDS